MTWKRISGIEAAVVKRVIVGNITLDLILMASVWGDWTAVLAIALCDLLRALVNTWATKHFGDDARGVPLMFTFNAAVNLALGSITGWNDPFIVAICYFIIVGDIFAVESKRWSWLLTPAYLGATALCGIAEGRSPAGILALCAVVALTGSVVRFRATRLADAAREIHEQHAELAAAHERLQLLQRRVLEQEKLSSLGEMAAGIAHEINNPMSFVTANLREVSAWMGRRLDRNDPAEAEMLDDILPSTLDGANRVNAIVADLRKFARTDVPNAVPFDLNEEIKSAARIAGSTIKHRGTIALELAALPKVSGHPQQMTQVFVNLFVNAGQAMDAATPGTIRVRSFADGREVVVSVSDDGRGMTPAIQERIFEPFFTTKPVGEGTGLGLSVVHGIVESHRGGIAVESQAGVGTTFTLRFPCGAAIAG